MNYQAKANSLGIKIYETSPTNIRFSTYCEVLCEVKKTSNTWTGFIYPDHMYLPVKRFTGHKHRVINQCLVELAKK